MKNTPYSRAGFAMVAMGGLLAVLESTVFEGLIQTAVIQLVAGIMMLVGAVVVSSVAWKQRGSTE